MTTVRQGDCVFSVDVENTEKYYAAQALCDCPYCRNYYAQIASALPQLSAFLLVFGADALRPDEVSSIEVGDHIVYLCVDYTVCGKIDAMPQNETDICGGPPIHVAFTDGFVSPNTQTDAYFTISVTDLSLPWVLDEPFPTAARKRSLTKIKGLFRKIGKTCKSASPLREVLFCSIP